ncbi:MAG: hypothetical protein AAB293_04350 [Pseudomonadota bacterium]
MKIINLLLLIVFFVFNTSVNSAPTLLLDSQSWDYTPSWMADTVTGKDRLWWCSDRFGSGIPNTEGDVIKYSEKIGNGSWSSPQTVLIPTMSGWEGTCNCDPAVVRGQFSYSNVSYSMAMYYTASPTCSTNNKIGVAFSNNGINWTKVNTPIISTQFTSNAASRYGAGQAQVRNINGGSAVQLWHTDTPSNAPTRIYERTSNNGINFSTAKALSKLGIHSTVSISGAGIALSPSTPYYLYFVARDGATSVLRIYKIPHDTRFTGTWTYLGSISPGSAGSNEAAIFEPGFRTDIYGNLYNLTFPQIWVGMGCGAKYVDQPGYDPVLWKLCHSSF